jgi:hypothetical protein
MGIVSRDNYNNITFILGKIQWSMQLNSLTSTQAGKFILNSLGFYRKSFNSDKIKKKKKKQAEGFPIVICLSVVKHLLQVFACEQRI